MKLKCYQAFCCCFDVAFGSVISAGMTILLSLIFLGISIERLIKASKLQADTDVASDVLLTTNDVALLKAIPSVNLVLSILLLVASMSLVIGAAHKRRRYVAVWIVVMPLWLIFCITQLSLTGNDKYRLHEAFEDGLHRRGGGSWYIAVAVLVGIFGIYSIGCVSILLHTLLYKEPVVEIKSMNISDTLHIGFRSGYGRLRESVRYSSRREPTLQTEESYRPNESSSVNVGFHSSDPVVLNPGQLDKSSSSGGQSNDIRESDMSMTNLAYTHDV